MKDSEHHVKEPGQNSVGNRKPMKESRREI